MVKAGIALKQWAIAAVAMVFLWVSPGVRAQSNEDCMVCHSDNTLVREYEGGRKVSMFVDESALGSSVHAPLGCVDCHQDLAGVADFPHAEEVADVGCGTCHEDLRELHERSVHGIALKKGETEAARCRDCHGTHYILPKSDPRSSVFHLKQPATCGACHGDSGFLQRHPGMPRAAQSYAESIHGKAVLKYGMNIAAVCSDCHGAHDIHARDDADGPLTRPHVAAVCGKCHPSALGSYRSGIHGVVSTEGKTEPAVCTDCHGEHTIRAPTDPSSSVYVTRIVETCSTCHADKEIVGKFGVSVQRVETYRESFHGLGTKYGSTVVANCVSCHQYHDIKPASDPSSSIHPQNLQDTCGQPRCHMGATERFAKSDVHSSITKPDDWVLQLVRAVYILIIGGTLGGMIIHNAIDYAGRRRHKRNTHADA